MSHHIAQINIATLRAPMDDPLIAGFANALDRINALAEASDGFIWRLKDDDGNDATSITHYDNPLVIVNMSVWRDVESLKHYTYHTDHVKIFKGRKTWFHRPNQAHMSLWKIEKGHIPTVDEGAERLSHFQNNGSSDFAFSFKDNHLYV